MGPAEIVASLKELCEDRAEADDRGNVAWIDLNGGFDSTKSWSPMPRR